VVDDLKRVFIDLVRLEAELWGAVDARLREECALSLSWFEPLRVIDQQPSCRVFEIADELSMTMGGTSKLVDRLEAAGLCRRRPNPGDRRSSLVELTLSGTALLGRANQVVEGELRKRVGAVLPPRTLQQLHHSVAALRVAARQNEAGWRSARSAGEQFTTR
jgi:DNA-binding MarR family transcriptional regulator